MSLTGRKTRKLNGREIMELWVELGSLSRVGRYYESKGMINDRTGSPFTQNALWRSAAVFMTEFPEEARELHQKAGGVYSDYEWEMLVLRRAIQIYRNSRSTFLRWVISKEWPKKYVDLYREEFNVDPETDFDYFTQTARRMPKREGQQPSDSQPVS